MVRNDGEVFFADANRRRSSGAEVMLQKNGSNLAAMIEELIVPIVARSNEQQKGMRLLSPIVWAVDN